LPKGWDDGVWTAADRAKLFGSKEQEKAYGLQAISILENYLATADLSVVPLALEGWLQCRLDGVTLRGRIDRIDQISEREIAVIDYKTGKLPFHSSGKKFMESGDFQLPIYAIIAGRLYPFAQTIRTALVYLKFSQVLEHTWTRAELEEHTPAVLEFIETIRHEQNFEPTPNPLCGWCEYRGICPLKQELPAAKMAIEEVTW
jgi:RecB family exonuclease